jgi:phage shock protein PspC (stress-responsive transcriptional regulator)
MEKVISINLNGNAYQLDESGYDALREYLAVAERELERNPDRAEIIVDLEQAIADKCRTFLGAHKSVVTSAEVEQIIKEMGPIETAKDDGAQSGDAGASRKQSDQTEAPPKRLYRHPEGAMIAGVCSGLAAYLGIDVAFVRIGFVLLAVITKGVGVILYVAMMFIIPEAQTAEERAAAGGLPFNAKEVIDRAKKHYAEGTRHWRRQLRQQQRHWRRYGRVPGAPFAYAQFPLVGAILPVFALVHLALFLTMAAMLISLVNTGGVLDWRLPPNVPVWAAALILLVGYQIVVSPLRALQHWSWQWRADGPPAYAFWNAVIWLIGLAFVLWIASNHIPEIREFLQRLPPLVRDFVDAIRDAIAQPK